MSIYRRELLFSIVCGMLALSGFIALPSLVAQPKLLFGRSLSAISPSLFPQYILLTIVVLSICLMLISAQRLLSKSNRSQSETTQDEDQQWLKKSVFFILLIAYGLMLKPLGFFLSSCIVIAGISLLLGNRNIIQIILLAIVSPVCLYLIATRAMLVSLPELNPVELFYSHVISWFRNT